MDVLREASKGVPKESTAPGRFLTAATLAAALMGLGGMIGLGGCAVVKPYEREILADPIMDPNIGFAKQTLLQKFLSTREGSTGGGTGLGGGCGCSK